MLNPLIFTCLVVYCNSMAIGGGVRRKRCDKCKDHERHDGNYQTTDDIPAGRKITAGVTGRKALVMLDYILKNVGTNIDVYNYRKKAYHRNYYFDAQYIPEPNRYQHTCKFAYPVTKKNLYLNGTIHTVQNIYFQCHNTKACCDLDCCRLRFVDWVVGLMIPGCIVGFCCCFGSLLGSLTCGQDTPTEAQYHLIKTKDKPGISNAKEPDDVEHVQSKPVPIRVTPYLPPPQHMPQPLLPFVAESQPVVMPPPLPQTAPIGQQAAGQGTCPYPPHASHAPYPTKYFNFGAALGFERLMQVLPRSAERSLRSQKSTKKPSIIVDI